MKCQLKPLRRDDYPVTFTDAQWQRLQQAFPGGVCDYTQAGREPARGDVPWLTYQDEARPRDLRRQADGQAAALAPDPLSACRAYPPRSWAATSASSPSSGSRGWPGSRSGSSVVARDHVDVQVEDGLPGRRLAASSAG